MTTRLLDYDPVAKSRTMFHALPDGEFVIEEVHDVEDVIEANKTSMSLRRARDRWADGLGDRVASIPLDIYYREVVIPGMSQADFRKWLDDKDRRAFRTRPGRLS